MLKRALAAAALIVAVALPAARADEPGPSCDWPMFGHDAGRSFAHVDGCTSVNATSVATLVPKWIVPTPDAASASPAIVDGHVYIGDWAGNFYSIDAETGTVEWTFVVDDTSSVGFGRIVSSAAVADVDDHRFVLFGGGATLYALDVTDPTRVGNVLRVCVDPRVDVDRCNEPGDQVEIESSPAVVHETDGSTSVVVGMDVHNSKDVGRTGVLKARLTATSLEPVWKFDPEARVAYTGDDMLTRGAGTGSGCAGVWGSPAVDVARGLVFFGTASCSYTEYPVGSGQDPTQSTGEHVWAVHLDSGALQWTYKAHEDDVARVDDDFGGALNLLPGGRVGAGSKDGWYYALDEVTGALAWSRQVGQPGHLSDGFAMGGVLASPATGVVNDPLTGRHDAVFLVTAASTPNDGPVGSELPPGVISVAADPQRMFSLHAIDATTGAFLWRSPASRQAFGAPTFVNGVVLVPATAGFQVTAIDANTGLPLAARPLYGPPSSAPTAYDDLVIGGIGTSVGEGSPLAPFSGVYAYEVVGG